MAFSATIYFSLCLWSYFVCLFCFGGEMEQCCPGWPWIWDPSALSLSGGWDYGQVPSCPTCLESAKTFISNGHVEKVTVKTWPIYFRNYERLYNTSKENCTVRANSSTFWRRKNIMKFEPRDKTSNTWVTVWVTKSSSFRWVLSRKQASELSSACSHHLKASLCPHMTVGVGNIHDE